MKRATAAQAALLVMTLASVLSACAPTLPVLVKPVDCPVPAELLTRRCDEPRPLPDGLSYADLIAIGIADRYALRRCALHDRLLADSLQACQRAIAEYNDKLREINEKNAAKP